MANNKGEYKGIKLGVMMTNKNGNKTIKLGSRQEGDKAQYNYTVQIRVLNSKGEVVLKTEDPWVTLTKPNTEKATKIEYNLEIFNNES